MNEPKCFKGDPNHQNQPERSCRACKFNKFCFNEWDEEFEDGINFKFQRMGFNDYQINMLTDKYLGTEYCGGQFKIKCKNGMIQIERIT